MDSEAPANPTENLGDVPLWVLVCLPTSINFKPRSTSRAEFEVHFTYGGLGGGPYVLLPTPREFGKANIPKVETKPKSTTTQGILSILQGKDRTDFLWTRDLQKWAHSWYAHSTFFLYSTTPDRCSRSFLLIGSPNLWHCSCTRKSLMFKDEAANGKGIDFRWLPRSRSFPQHRCPFCGSHFYVLRFTSYVQKQSSSKWDKTCNRCECTPIIPIDIGSSRSLGKILDFSGIKFWLVEFHLKTRTNWRISFERGVRGMVPGGI